MRLRNQSGPKFSVMMTLAVRRPLERVVGARRAEWAVFLLSGAMHELAISLPVEAGYGLPTLYFALHALAMQLERRRGRAPGRLWVAAWVLLPAPMLFHLPFVTGVLGPLLE